MGGVCYTDDRRQLLTVNQTKAPGVVPDLAEALFGDEAFFRQGLTRPAVTAFVDGLLTLTWNRWRTWFGRDQAALEREERALESAEKGKSVK